MEVAENPISREAIGNRIHALLLRGAMNQHMAHSNAGKASIVKVKACAH
jgi:hypothetical protein